MENRIPTNNLFKSSTSYFMSYTHSMHLWTWCSSLKGKNLNFHNPLFLIYPRLTHAFPTNPATNTIISHIPFTYTIHSPLNATQMINKSHNSQPTLDPLQGINREHTFWKIPPTILDFYNHNLHFSLFNCFDGFAEYEVVSHNAMILGRRRAFVTND